jgi:hypothetical protein
MFEAFAAVIVIALLIACTAMAARAWTRRR